MSFQSPRNRHLDSSVVNMNGEEFAEYLRKADNDSLYEPIDDYVEARKMSKGRSRASTSGSSDERFNSESFWRAQSSGGKKKRLLALCERACVCFCAAAVVVGLFW